ncbi:hTAFII28-like protein conserved region-domain-containing protein [Emericellopsis atlantica]|uniref:HTAFII28-like protein conserved region-domain-containing protein n=1 Tax=Emericellopsis atlantica TaxID=2614577 RepID=A0A9P8CKE9_9HYPO|nr:hTAFII28-like protein conserved region-domain-containing protein [Emericellopsis atlantica]KAG9250288.1 hTAFII28-like protein conserved region-domain-containing protein [Emericellopsis atlantica]
MASPPNPGSPLAMSPPNPAPAQIPNKKRSSSTLDISTNAAKRRKPSQPGTPAHPLRQTSFPPPEAVASPAVGARSPSVDAASVVSGSQVSASQANGKKKRGRKPKSAKPDDREGSVAGDGSVAGGSKAPTSMANGAGKDGEEEEEEDKPEMALEDVVARTQEQKQEEVRLRAMLVESMDKEQMARYENWRASKLQDSVVKRVVNATVSQSVPPTVSMAVRSVTKLFAGELVELARQVQAEMITAGEVQSEAPRPPSLTALPEETNEELDLRRAPLRPEHLREAWRRYKLSGESGGVGVQQLWHAQQNSGTERFSTRTGKRMFR